MARKQAHRTQLLNARGAAEGSTSDRLGMDPCGALSIMSTLDTVGTEGISGTNGIRDHYGYL